MGLRLAKSARRPTAIVALNDLMALGLMAGLREADIRVPHDISVVGMDGLVLSALANPALTTVELPVREMAKAMVEKALGARAGAEESASEQVFKPTRLIERESVAQPPTVRQACTAGTKPRAK
jgi:DNA-binding LacI/PurR family transcriptional regulator